jgi:hypothetical protein
MNALKKTSIVTQMQLALILKAHTAVSVKTDTRGLGKRTAEVKSSLSNKILFSVNHKT